MHRAAPRASSARTAKLDYSLVDKYVAKERRFSRVNHRYIGNRSVYRQRKTGSTASTHSISIFRVTDWLTLGATVLCCRVPGHLHCIVRSTIYIRRTRGQLFKRTAQSDTYGVWFIAKGVRCLFGECIHVINRAKWYSFRETALVEQTCIWEVMDHTTGAVAMFALSPKLQAK